MVSPFALTPVSLFLFAFYILSIQGKDNFGFYGGAFLGYKLSNFYKNNILHSNNFSIFSYSILFVKGPKARIKIYLVFAFSSICGLLILYSLHSYILTNSLSNLSSTVMKGQAIIAMRVLKFFGPENFSLGLPILSVLF